MVNSLKSRFSIFSQLKNTLFVRKILNYLKNRTEIESGLNNTTLAEQSAFCRFQAQKYY